MPQDVLVYTWDEQNDIIVIIGCFAKKIAGILVGQYAYIQYMGEAGTHNNHRRRLPTAQRTGIAEIGQYKMRRCSVVLLLRSPFESISIKVIVN